MMNAPGVLDGARIPWQWDVDPFVSGLLLVVAAAYVAGSSRQWMERRQPRSAAARAAAFGAGMLVLVMTLLSPLDAWGDELFAAHMAQHLMLMMVAPPLLLLGRPFIVALWAAVDCVRRSMSCWPRSRHGWRPVRHCGSGTCRSPTVWRFESRPFMRRSTCRSS